MFQGTRLALAYADDTFEDPNFDSTMAKAGFNMLSSQLEWVKVHDIICYSLCKIKSRYPYCKLF